MLSADDRKIKDLLAAWHKNQVVVEGPKYQEGFFDRHSPKSAKDRTKFIALDYGTSGHFLVDRKTEQVYSIKGYGVANLKKPRGTVEFLTKFINTLTEQGKEYMSTYWYKLHVTDKDLGVFCKEVDGRILISGIDYNGSVKIG